jgi:hypothetical protein
LVVDLLKNTAMTIDISRVLFFVYVEKRGGDPAYSEIQTSVSKAL